MAELADHLTKESVHALHDAFIEGVLTLERTPKGSIGLNSRTFEEVGEPIVRFAHARLWEQARPNKDPRLSEYSHYSRANLVAILTAAGVSDTGTGKAYRLGGDIGRVLSGSGLAKYIEGKWYLRPWNSDRLQWVVRHTKIDPATEQRIEEEADKPVESRTDLKTVKLPANTPESILEFVERFVPAALKVQAQRDSARDMARKYHAELVDAQAQIERLKAQLEEAAESKEEQAAWSGVSDRVSQLLLDSKT